MSSASTRSIVVPGRVAIAMPSGRLITIEGIDGAGKTTLAAALCDELLGRGIPVSLLREPGGVPLAEKIRELVKDPQLRISAAAEALLYAAARAELVEQAIKPLLKQGRWVLLDRFVDSSLAYQGAGRNLGVEAIGLVNELAIGGLSPDRTLLLVLDPSVGRRRSGTRAEPVDRLEREDEAFFTRVAEGYLQIAALAPQRFRLLDAGEPPSEVLRAALNALEGLI